MNSAYYVFRYKILVFLRIQNTPLNTCQICRMMNGAKHIHDIIFCTSGFKDKWKNINTFKKHGNFPYHNCLNHKHNWKIVYYCLTVLEKKGYIISKKVKFVDPINPYTKDDFRMWGLKKVFPNLDQFIIKDSEEILNA